MTDMAFAPRFGSPRPPANRPARPAPGDLGERRMAAPRAPDMATRPGEPRPEEVMIGGVRALRFTPPGRSRGVVLHLHGGAFQSGSPEAAAAFAAVLATRCAMTVICPEYRLAPAAPYPAGLSDAQAALEGVRALYDGPVILSGDSAGAGLAASLAARSASEGRPLAGLLLLSPWLDLTLSADSYATNADSDPVFSLDAARTAADLYLQGHAPDDKQASPLLGPVKGLPPTFLNVGSGEVLVDDARRFWARLRAEGTPAYLQVLAGMDQAAVTRSNDLPGARDALEALVAFVNRTLARARP